MRWEVTWNIFVKTQTVHWAIGKACRQDGRVSQDCILDKWDKVDTFVVFLIFIHQYWLTSAIILSGDQWFNAYAIVSSGNFRISGRTGLLFGPNQTSFFLSKQQLLDFQYCFSFSGANCWASLVNFSKLSFGKSQNYPIPSGRWQRFGYWSPWE